jgi:hypothetical protein
MELPTGNGMDTLLREGVMDILEEMFSWTVCLYADGLACVINGFLLTVRQSFDPCDTVTRRVAECVRVFF